jgi:hypothetical protein
MNSSEGGSSPRPVDTTNSIECRNPQCNYKGRAQREPRGNLGTGLLLFFAGCMLGMCINTILRERALGSFWYGLIAVVIYCVLMSGYRLRCPLCWTEITIPRVTLNAAFDSKDGDSAEAKGAAPKDT